ncbi:hypothetical protein [Brevundimonas sp.]|uniref:hypothetical protein n=1 Tax=Brevundimonas sp. TaxID=1871086 RepID=UPI0028AA4319|nr:hypothetical protein [Brevundimonas sp.]
MLMIAMAFAAQTTVLPELPRTYVSAEAARQTPCPVAVSAPPHPERFPNSLLIGAWMMRTERGTLSCRFHQTEAGHCNLRDPGRLVVEQGDATTIYDIPNGADVEFEARDGRYACRIGRRIRTHGDTIVPNRER